MTTLDSARMKNVTRYDYCRTAGWVVRGKGIVQKLFSDNKYGSPGTALDAALMYRDSFPSSSKSRVRFYQKPSRRNRSGRVGVSELFGRKGDTTGWRVVWCEPVGVMRQNSFLVSKYGTSTKARKAAIVFREQVEKRMGGGR